MKQLIYCLIIIFASSFTLLAQDLPKQMTEEEKLLWENYSPLIYPEYTTPPPVPVRTMAEWEELQGVMITWTSQQAILREVVRHAQDEAKVFIVCSDSNTVRNYLTNGGVPLNNIRFLLFPFNSIWIRDYGPWTVYSETSDSLYIIDWTYNRPRPNDDNIPVLFANTMNIPIYQTTQAPYNLVHTGGNFMVDGLGTGFSSKLVLNENPGKTEAQINDIMNQFMGISRYIKMENLPYDVIHHIDMHMKLLDEETLLVGQYPPGVADGPFIEANLQYVLNNFLTPYGKPYRVVRIPMPPDQFGRYPDNNGYYRTYTNSIIINKTVLVPTYEPQYDTTALRIYREAMPGYKIVGINCNSIIPSNGALHCIVKEVGAHDPLFISHSRIGEIVEGPGPFEIKAIVRTQTGITQAQLFWTSDTLAGYSPVPMASIGGDTLSAVIPAQINTDEIFYYISATSGSGKTLTKPITAPQGFYNFKIDDPVPVEMLSFSGRMSGTNVFLEWSTATETNNFGFEVQRMVPGSKDFATIGFVRGNGTTNALSNYSFMDESSVSGNSSYRLKQIDLDGTFEYSKPIYIEFFSYDYSLAQNYPNPFNPSTVISFTLPVDGKVTLKVFDVLGNEVATLADDFRSAGRHTINFNASGLPSNVYFYSLQAGGYSAIKKMLLVK